jgi:antimicrobial peptide system SdpA family protein
VTADDAQRGAENTTADYGIGIYVVLLGLFWGTVLTYTVHPVLPANPIELPFEDKSPFIYLLPQGWAFFTRDPRLPIVEASLKREHGTWERVSPRASHLPTFYGFSRRWKLPDVEVGLILDALAVRQWNECEGSWRNCLDAVAIVGSVKNLLPNATLCGEIGIVRQQPVPWAWSRTDRPVVMPSEVLRLHVACR